MPNPLWVIDGVPMQKEVPTPPVSNTQIRSGDFSNIFATGIGGINPNDIESISVLKDAPLPQFTDLRLPAV